MRKRSTASYLIDLHVWLALTWDRHPQHVPASRWYGSIDDAALQFYDRCVQDPRAELAAEPRGAETLFRQAIAPFALQTATKAVADCYLIGFAEAAGAHVVTFDRALAATAIFRQVPVALLDPVAMRKCRGNLRHTP